MSKWLLVRRLLAGRPLQNAIAVLVMAFSVALAVFVLLVSLLAQVVGVGKQQVDAIMANGQNDNSMRTRRNRQRFYTDYGMDQRLADYQRY